MSSSTAASTTRSLSKIARGTDKSMLLCDDGRGEETFFGIYLDLVSAGQVSNLPASGHPTAIVHPSAVVMEHVQLGAHAVVDPGAVIYPNSVLGEGAVVKANATIGGEGFEVKYVGGRRTLIPHTGGVFLDDATLVGSSTCIDRGLFGTFTRIGAGSPIDNLVHIATMWSSKRIVASSPAPKSLEVHTSAAASGTARVLHATTRFVSATTRSWVPVPSSPATCLSSRWWPAPPPNNSGMCVVVERGST